MLYQVYPVLQLFTIFAPCKRGKGGQALESLRILSQNSKRQQKDCKNEILKGGSELLTA